jgi:hypothetical protein
MKELHEDLAENWLIDRAYPSLDDIYKVPPEGAYLLRKDSGFRVETARRLAHCFKGSDVLYGIMQIDIFPSAEDRFIFKKFLESGGIGGAPDNVSYILFDRKDEDYLRGTLALSLLFIYEGFLASADKNCFLYFSHDEWVQVVDPAGESGLEQVFANLRLQRMSAS